MKLYYAKGSCSLSVHIALVESDLPYQLELVDLRSNPHTTENGTIYTTINPKGAVPALLLDNGTLLTEGVAISQYIADQVPSKKLAPANGTLTRYQLQEWLNHIATDIHKGFSPLWSPTSSAEQKDAAWLKLSKHFTWIDHHLAEQDYLMGEFSIADAYLFTCLRWISLCNYKLDAWKNLQKFFNKTLMRPATQKAMQKEGLI